MAKETYHMAKETYHMAKETYHMSKETYHMAKETYIVAHNLKRDLLYIVYIHTTNKQFSGTQT